FSSVLAASRCVSSGSHLPILFFFFYGLPYYLSLHSFPTRRSSDLWDRDESWRGGQSRRQGGTRDRPRPRESPAGGLPRASVGDSDRKSTRLNSSHQIISYAVFCLKKKKKAQKKRTAPRETMNRNKT